MAQWEDVEEALFRDIEAGNNPFKLFENDSQDYIEVRHFSALNQGWEDK